jgi:hypothetical protein
MPVVPPGGFATINVKGVYHGARHVPTELRLRITSDSDRAAILVKLDGRYLTQSGRPFQSRTTNPLDVPQWDFRDRKAFAVSITGLAPGVHHLEIRDGMLGSSLPIVNQQDLWFSVGQ